MLVCSIPRAGMGKCLARRLQWHARKTAGRAVRSWLGGFSDIDSEPARVHAGRSQLQPVLAWWPAPHFV